MRLPKRLDLVLKQDQSKERASDQGEASPDAAPLAGLAPRWHTLLLVCLIVAVFVSGSLLAGSESSRPSPASRTTAVYLPLLLVEWGLLFYVARIGRGHSALRDLLGKSWNSARRALTDLALAAVVFAQIQGVELLARLWLGSASNPARDALLPVSAREWAIYGFVAVSAGFCEELVYRGYLLVQLGAFTGSIGLGCVLQAALFGLAHAEQGAAVALRFALYAGLLGGLAVWRRTLIPGIVAHVALDLAAGLR